MKKALIFVIAAITLAALYLAFASCKSQNYEYKSYLSTEKIDEIELDLKDRRVEVSVIDENDTKIEYFNSETEHLELVEADGKLSASIEYDKELSDYFGVKGEKDKRTIKLFLPAKVYSRITIKTTNGSVILPPDISADRFELAANNGNIEFSKLNVNNSFMSTVKNGNISGSLYGSYDEFRMEISIKKGKSNLVDKKDGFKLLSLDANNGDIDVNLIKKQ